MKIGLIGYGKMGGDIFSLFFDKLSDAEFVVLDTFGKEAMITPCGEDRFDIHIRGSRSGILLFAQQYIDAVSIAEPEDLRNEMLDRLKKAAEEYKK